MDLPDPDGPTKAVISFSFASKEIGSLLDTEEMEHPEKRVQLKGEKIEFSNVSFSYKDTEVLHSISYRKPTQVDEERILRPTGEALLRNSAK